MQIPLTGWLLIVVGYTMWPVANWSAWPVLVIIVFLEAAVMIICAKLLTIVMLLTRNNTLHNLTTKAFWYDNPGLLLPIIRNILFMLTAVLASVVRTFYSYVLYTGFVLSSRSHGSMVFILVHWLEEWLTITGYMK